MMLTELQEVGEVASLDIMLGFQTLNPTDAETNRQSRQGSEERRTGVEETPGFKRSTQ